MSSTVDREVELAGLASSVRAATASDVIDDVQPRCVVEPSSPEEAAAVLAWCSRQRQSVVIRGGSSRMSWGRVPGPVDVVLSMRRLTRITRYEPADLTVTADAGISVAALNEELAKHGQWLPIDVPSSVSTIGGAIATNESGPLRHRYGTPRDQLIGIHLATVDGRIAASGGTVVKNVAGYDLGKLVAGSFGALAGIVSASFKLAPMPAASTTLMLTFRDAAATAAAAAEMAASQLDPLGLEAEAIGGAHNHTTFRLLVRFGGTSPANREQIEAAARIADANHPLESDRLSGMAEGEVWRGRSAGLWARPGAIVRVSWMPARLGAVLALVEELALAGSVVEFAGRAAVGGGALRIDADTERQIFAIARLRERPDTVGHVVVMRAAPDVKGRVDVWGQPPSAVAVIGAIKHALDPAGVLNAGRGPV